MKHIEKNYQRGMFDEQQRLEKLSAQKDPLEALQKHINFEFFVMIWKNILHREKITAKADDLRSIRC